MKDKHIINAVRSINTDMHGSPNSISTHLAYITDGWERRVEFGGWCIWMDSDDTREYDENTDEWEPIEECLRREILKLLERYQGASTRIKSKL